MNELVIISGKGGCGKTTIAASLAALADNPVIADCDVDAADLHLVLKPEAREASDFYSGYLAELDAEKCTGCGKCVTLCRFSAITRDDKGTIAIDPLACEGCGVCMDVCPFNAVTLPEQLCGCLMVSDTPYGPLAHAKLGIGAENSGKLVTAVRNEAKKLATEIGSQLILIDGSPGLGCPVISSLTGASMALITTEPTVSGLHDMERILKLTIHFGIKAYVCVSKADLNPSTTKQLKKLAEHHGAKFLGTIAYDTTATQAQIEARPLVEFPESPAGNDIKKLWQALAQEIESNRATQNFPIL
ncbi:MAG: ATP-binding protein [Planctomycetia bacterium]|jgi:MinD superfamily P-loop ATPase